MLDVFLSLFSFLAVFTSVIGLLPQVYKSYVTKSTSDISMLMLINYLACSISWIVHGIVQFDIFVLLSNLAGLAISLILILQKRYYDKMSRINKS